MNIVNNLVTPSIGNKLKHIYSDTLYDELCLGKNKYKINGKIQLIDLSINDIYEISNIEIEDKNYQVKLSNDYSELVTNLIRLKYSLNDELALMANSRIKDNSEDEQKFLNWRILCKNLAKSLINE